MASRVALIFLFLAFVISVTIRNPLLFLLNLVLLSIFFVSWLWGRYCLAAVTYARRFTTDRLFPGEETDFWIEVVNAKPMTKFPTGWGSFTPTCRTRHDRSAAS